MVSSWSKLAAPKRKFENLPRGLPPAIAYGKTADKIGADVDIAEETMKNPFNSFLKPYIEYGNLAWGGAPKTKIELINRTIKRSIRALINKDKFDSVKPFYEYLNILPFKDNMKLLQGKFMWKLVNAVCPNSISEKFPLTYSEAINNHQNKLGIPYCHRALSKRSLISLYSL